MLNGWQISGITTFQSGAPVAVGYSLVTANDLSGTPSISPRILVVGDPNLAKGDRTFYKNFNTDVFRVPAAGTLGTMSKNLLRGPGINNWDIAMFKNLRSVKAFGRNSGSEGYNAFNHTQFSTFDQHGPVRCQRKPGERPVRPVHGRPGSAHLAVSDSRAVLKGVKSPPAARSC